MAKKSKTNGPKYEPHTEEFGVVNVKFLALKSGVDYPKIHHNLSGRYVSLTENDKTMMANALHAEVSKAFKFLGFNLREHTRIKD